MLLATPRCVAWEEANSQAGIGLKNGNFAKKPSLIYQNLVPDRVEIRQPTKILKELFQDAEKKKKTLNLALTCGLSKWMVAIIGRIRRQEETNE